MNDRFTERFKKVLFLARDEAGRLQHDYIGTEHFLLGIAREGEGIGAKVLQNLGLSLPQIQQVVEKMVAPSGGTVTIGEIPFTPRAKRVLELSVEEARLLGHSYIGTEHLLLGLIREGEGVAARVLIQLDVTSERVREETHKLLSDLRPDADAAIPEVDPLMRRTLMRWPIGPEKRIQALCRILIRKGIITEDELDEELHRMM